MVYLSARYALIEDSDPEAMGLAAGTFSKMKASVVCTFRHEAAARLIYQAAGLSDHG